MKETFDWGGILGKPSYSLQNKIIFFAIVIIFPPSYSRFFFFFFFLSKNSSKINSRKPNTMKEILDWAGILRKLSYR